MVQKVPEAVAKNICRSELNARALVHSSLDLSATLYDFANWLGDEAFVSIPPAGADSNIKISSPSIDIK